MMRRMPSFRGIEAFLYLVEAGGIRAAARAMNLSVSAVSHRLRTLEAEVGVTLFERGSRKLNLTVSAQTFYAELQPIALELAKATARLARQGEGQVLRVGASSIIISNWLAGRLRDWRDREPSVRLELVSLDNASDTNCDIAIRTRYQREADEGEILLFPWELTPICRPEVIVEYGVRTPADLANAPLLDVETPVGGWPSWLQSVGLPSNIGDRSIVLSSHESLLDAVTRGLGIATGAMGLQKEYRARGLVMPFPHLKTFLKGGVYVDGVRPGESAVAARFRQWAIDQSRS